jgi:hypothetical protein
VTIAALVGHAKGSVTSKYIYTHDTALIMLQTRSPATSKGLLDGVEFKQTASAGAALVRFSKRASGAD